MIIHNKEILILENGRDRKIDIIRFIAIFCIILAHSQAPSIILELRNFDVVAMVFLSGISFYLSNDNKKVNLIDYSVKRFKRLIIPTWLFLTLFFMFFYILAILIGKRPYFDLSNIILSYSMLTGIGYVWVMRIFFVVAIVSPLLLFISNKIKSNLNYFLVLALIYAGYYGLLILYNEMTGLFKFLFEPLILQSIGYSLIASVGIRFKKMDYKEIIVGMTVFFMIYLILMKINNFETTQESKYPPTMYYISYGLFMSFLLYIILERIPIIYNFCCQKYVFFLAENSLTLYFWHIIPVQLISIFKDKLILVNENFIYRFIFIVVISVSLTYLHINIKDKFNENKIKIIKL